MASTAKRSGVVGAAALAVIALCRWEGMDLKAQHQRIDPPGVITACIGQTNYDDPTLKVGQKFTPDECKERLLKDLPKYERQVDRCIHVPMPPHRRAALISFTYNLGGGALCKSSVARNLNAGRVAEGCAGMMNYTKANGRVLQGLVNRRKFERDWCNRED